ncbi:MFS transporter [Qaidamihabitans albus]|uniref:MFS transporter n=1 Tax=Qaidamihabitans albus TaxID=2795733 RepID=UPI0018F15300|nr:MFS transporter [Qaidamihabitans albus]
MRGTLTSTAVTVGTLVPLLLLVALQPFIVNQSPGLRSFVSAVIAVHYLTVGLLSRPFGHAVDRLGFLRPALVGVLAAALTAVVLSWHGAWPAGLLVGCVLAGAAVALGHTASAVWVVHTVNPARHGVAMGVRQASVPISALLAGVVAPVGAVALGTGAVFLVLVPPLLVIAVLVLTMRHDTVTANVAAVAVSRGRAPTSNGLRMLTLASALGAGGANSALILVPVSAVDRGLGPADGALALAIGGAVSAFGRVLIGSWIDRRGVDPSRVAAVIMLAGAATLAVSVLARSSVPFLVVTGLALMGTGSWQGLLMLGAVQRRIDRPGAASGAMASSAQLATGITLLGLSAVTAHRSAIEAFWVPVILLSCAALMVLASTVVRPRAGK